MHFKEEILAAQYPSYTLVQIRKFYERKIVIIFLPINLSVCFGCSKEPSHRDGSFEYPQHMFWVRNKETIFQLRSLIWSPVIAHSFIKFGHLLVNDQKKEEF